MSCINIQVIVMPACRKFHCIYDVWDEIGTDSKNWDWVIWSSPTVKTTHSRHLCGCAWHTWSQYIIIFCVAKIQKRYRLLRAQWNVLLRAHCDVLLRAHCDVLDNSQIWSRENGSRLCYVPVYMHVWKIQLIWVGYCQGIKSTCLCLNKFHVMSPWIRLPVVCSIFG